jgi:hypothetical protein
MKNGCNQSVATRRRRGRHSCYELMLTPQGVINAQVKYVKPECVIFISIRLFRLQYYALFS